MKLFLAKHKTFVTLLLFALFPSVLFAQTGSQNCSSSGYTITTINGVLTDEDGAIANRDALKYYFKNTYNGEPLTIDYLLNPPHALGLGDILKSIKQGLFDSEAVVDYDLANMINDASAKVKTQKLLLVAHSQGNFYANSFYDVVAGQVGGVPKESIGVFSVATPSDHVAGGGGWIISDTDKVIAGLVGHIPFKKIMPPNKHIGLQSGDDSLGHDFSGVYLKYLGTEIVSGIQSSLEKLTTNTIQPVDSSCISVQKLSFMNKIAGVTLAVVDTVFNTTAGAFAASYNTYAKIFVWTYDTGIAVSSAVYNAIASAFSNGFIASNNNASVILATLPAQTQENSTPVNNQVVAILQPPVTEQSATAPQKPQAVFVFEPKVQVGTNAPKLVFVGSFGGGGGAQASPAPQVLGTQTTVVAADEATTDGEVVGGAGAGAAMAAPALSVPQCALSLATDGCLLATTTVRFEWSPVSGANHYLTNKNGEYATTTNTTLDLTIKDFSDYTLEVVAIGSDSNASATSTQNVSVATIPIAINEIAWMGTTASLNDEWFEIKNNTSHTLDLSQWALNAKDGTPNVAMKGTIDPHAYIIFERTNDETVKDVLAHATTTGALNNGGDQLTLSRDSVIFDQTPDGAWVAGATSTRQTMERYSSRESGTDPSNWGTNLGYIKNGTDAAGKPIEGTPGAQNSVSTLINKGQDITSNLTLTPDEERYVVPNQLWVDASSTLVIEPGVTIQFYSGEMWVNGAVLARGTQENPVIFNSFSEKRDGDFWIDNATGTSTFEYAHFENMNNVFAVDGGVLEISDSEFVNTDGGVSAYGKNSRVFIENTRFASSTDDTIGVYNGGVVSIASSTIENQIDDDAIGVYYSSLIMSSTTIDGVHDGNGIGAYYSLVSIASSTVSNTESDALWLSNSTTTIANTVVQGGVLNDSDGVSGISIDGGMAAITNTAVSGFTGGIGIAVSEPKEPVVITGGEVTWNAVGVAMYPDGAAVVSDVSSVHDNGTSESDNIVAW